MKPLVYLFGAGVVAAVTALVADSVFLLLFSVLLFAGVILGTLLLGLRAAQKGNLLVPYVVVLAAGLAVAAAAVASIVEGASADAPGLVLLGIVLIVSVIVGVFTLGLRSAQRVG